jgi:hypothetical protein
MSEMLRPTVDADGWVLKMAGPLGKAMYSPAKEVWGNPFVFQAPIRSDTLGLNKGFGSVAESKFSGGRR